MTTMILSLFNPNSLLPHRAGVAGLALALSGLDEKDAPLQWEVTDDEVRLSWECTDKEAIQWLMSQTYQIKDGFIAIPFLKLDEQSLYIFTNGLTSTFLQYQKQRKFDSNTQSKSFKIDENQPEVRLDNYRPVLSCYYTGDFKEAFNTRGNFKKEIPLKSHHLPGLIEDFSNGAYKESPENYLALLFLPIACQYYQLPGYLSALVIPAVMNLPAWVNRRKVARGKTAQKLTPYGEFRANGAGESALRFLLQEKLIEDSQEFRVNYCEVYRLGKQPWDGNQSYLKQEVYRVHVTDQVLELYQNAWQLFPAVVRKTQDKDGEKTWLAASKVLPWIADNLIVNKRWYEGFFSFRKTNEIYERKGLTQMTNYLDPLEQTFFDAIKGGFSTYLHGQIEQANKQGRKLDYPQVTKKIIYLLQRPNTQLEFAGAVVDFLSRNPNKAARGAGPEIYQWLHRDRHWKQARDLALLAIATYEGKNKQGETEVPEEILDQAIPDTESESGLELELA
ncbi:type I-MYXAN CRISPR-associated Cas8a1/Cmx1 [Synechocystis sp. PCC 7339]|uniref:type I-MYXAN CRISPR-associated Cas8a1/Cmx1 n=1 Tax=unclassified Synechocystis TaxID=2640012 RepID=UPI001BAFBBCB|nr:MULTISPECIES: type I-MYXAN CRISPR-associated Cas8a1/Cmx1 [unclassified Synechocystis]QUS60089.1 type I-MYXAN CRISPR-associated Cas8a1/Cmx1 [Synechocystis sp. PCC 7338]UAJ72464.1 type I-MYXAN CRISPR-associated Cas8a1/Cmx1 [Synechocystis sp. PCC 7339]